MSSATKKATNISLSVDVLAAAKASGINISQECDAHLREVVNKERERHWLVEHVDFISAYSQNVEAEGLPLEQYRLF